jgi:hypothetical protein
MIEDRFCGSTIFSWDGARDMDRGSHTFVISQIKGIEPRKRRAVLHGTNSESLNFFLRLPRVRERLREILDYIWYQSLAEIDHGRIATTGEAYR